MLVSSGVLALATSVCAIAGAIAKTAADILLLAAFFFSSLSLYALHRPSLFWSVVAVLLNAISFFAVERFIDANRLEAAHSAVIDGKLSRSESPSKQP
jgi:hypothetical protein